VRHKKRTSTRARVFTPEQLAKQFEKQREQDKDRKLEKEFKRAIRGFRPRKSELGRIIVLSRKGERVRGNSRVGYAVYINTKGKKIPVKQYDRQRAKIEKFPKARRISEIDASRVRSKRAKKRFFEAHTREVDRGVTTKQARFGYKRQFHRVDVESQFAQYASEQMLRMLRGTKSIERNYSLMIGLNVTTPDGLKWFETQISALPGDIRKAKINTITVERLREFFGRQVYAFLARELEMAGYVMAGSARYVSNLPENENQPRERWTKEGHHWPGTTRQDVTVNSVEWRFLQNTFEERK
jgi:hypothetical protein